MKALLCIVARIIIALLAAWPVFLWVLLLINSNDSQAASRCLRLNNPTCIEKSSNNFAGESRICTDKRFTCFYNREYGYRAAAKILLTYQREHGLITVKQMIGRWAPAQENHTRNYAAFVASRMSVGVNDRIDVTVYTTMVAMISAIARYETGEEPSHKEVAYGVLLANVHPEIGESL